MGRPGLSVVVLSQQLTSIAKPFRENIQKLVTFYNPSKNDMELSKEELIRINQELKTHKCAKLEIDLVHPYSYKVVK